VNKYNLGLKTWVSIWYCYC